ncbi:hypothetical protein DL93DRAFT_2234175 [Clavulina sp. PMI_390]|nr:hypothetical protein DL93DRAFT_2234175 [Clavulina sp. PMI_390]
MSLSTVPDYLHQVKLGALSHHIRNILGISMTDEDGNGLERPPNADSRTVKLIREALEKGENIRSFPTQEKYRLAWELGLRRGVPKGPYLEAKLAEYAKKLPIADMALLPDPTTNDPSSGVYHSLSSSHSGVCDASFALFSEHFPYHNSTEDDGAWFRSKWPELYHFVMMQTRSASGISSSSTAHGSLTHATAIYNASSAIKKRLALYFLESWPDDPYQIIAQFLTNRLDISNGFTIQNIEYDRRKFTTASQATINSWRKPLLVHICRSFGIEINHSWTKKAITTRLMSWRDQQPWYNPAARAQVPKASGLATRGEIPCILGKTTMADIRRLVSTADAPLWIPIPSADFAMTTPSLSGGRWESLARYFLVAAVIPIWSFPKHGTSAEERQRMEDLLENLMDLVQAVALLGSYSPSSSDLDQGDKLFRRYLIRMQELHAHAPVVPNHHLTTHFAEFVRLYGSPHTFGAWVVEVVIGSLRDIQTNSNEAEANFTRLRTYARASNLRALIQETQIEGFNDLRQELKAISKSRRFQEEADPGAAVNTRGSAGIFRYRAGQTDFNDAPPDVKAYFASILICRQVSYVTIAYSCLFQHALLQPRSSSKKNCWVIYLNTDGVQRGGLISSILECTTVTGLKFISLVVEPFRELSPRDAELNCFRRKWEHVAGRLYDPRTDSKDIVPLEKVMSQAIHFPYLPPPHVLPFRDLDRDAILLMPATKNPAWGGFNGPLGESDSGGGDMERFCNLGWYLDNDEAH